MIIFDDDNNPVPKLVQSVINNNLKQVKEILKSTKYDINVRDWKDKTAMHYACEMGFTEMVKYLIQEGADIEAEENSWTPLLLASERGHLEVIRLLLAAGANIETPTLFNKNTPISWAAMSGHTACVKLLLENGARIDVPTANGCYPYELVSPAHADITQLFQKYQRG